MSNDHNSDNSDSSRDNNNNKSSRTNNNISSCNTPCLSYKKFLIRKLNPHIIFLNREVLGPKKLRVY